MGRATLDKSEMDRLPPGCDSFSALRNNGAIYVDKTDMIGHLARLDASPVFISRPRRFGKSLLLSTLESLFSRGLKDFENLKIIRNDFESDDRFWHNEKIYKVIHLDFSNYADCDLDSFKYGLTIDLQCMIKGKTMDELTPGEKSLSPTRVLLDCRYTHPGKKLVLLIDEYDSPITHNVSNPQKTKEMMDFISSFFATIKSCEGMFRFVCITGVTSLAHVSLFSMFNSLADITVDEDYSALLGITEDELHEYFDTYVQNAAAVLDMIVSDVYARLKSTYNGFQFAINAQRTVYNPSSFMSFLRNPEQGFSNHWYSSGCDVPTLLVRYLRQKANLKIFNLLLSKALNQNCDDSDERISLFGLCGDTALIGEYAIMSMPDKIPMNLLLYQTGCLTLKQTGKHRAKLVIPNDEVVESMILLSLDIRKLEPSEDVLSHDCSLA